MNRRHVLGLTTLLVFAAACQDIDQAVGPTDVAPGPSLSVQQQNDRVAPGRILVRLADGADVTLTVGDGTGSHSVTDTVSCRVRGKRARCK
ncbi:MAG: hypothetical protein P8L30_04980 [Longimicrobiales bacterium]|jgi:hypothetical protein|nr:hypothetical protein [Longimicrobiales bacterium]